MFGGSLKVVSGARVDGDVGIVGGALKREEGAIIGGKVVDSANGQHGNVKVTMHDGEVSTEVEGDRKRASGRGRLTEAVHSFGQSVTNMSLLFVFGCVLLALGTRKMETLRVEAAARPMKSFAMGIVGSFCALVALVAMCVTLVGIPFAVLLLLLGALQRVRVDCSGSHDGRRRGRGAQVDEPVRSPARRLRALPARPVSCRTSAGS